MQIRDRPSLIRIFANESELGSLADSVFIFGVTEAPVEDRHGWGLGVKAATIVKIKSEDRASFIAEINGNEIIVQLRGEKNFSDFFNRIKEDEIYIDITSLSHHIWAPLIRTAIKFQKHVIAIYVEPKDYLNDEATKDGLSFNLSERSEGIFPIPGFASLNDDYENGFCFIPLLGFEGQRLAHIVEKIEPQPETMYPIIGLPGFRIEYPFYTIDCNRGVLKETKSWKNVRYADASDPFNLYYTLQEISDKHQSIPIKIALLGTKPHALGALLFSLKKQRNIEFIYDHPIKKKGRSEGIGRLHLYYISDFLNGGA